METGGCFAFLFGADDEDEETIWTDWKGPSSESSLKEARTLARNGARDVYKAVKQSINSKTTTAMQID